MPQDSSIGYDADLEPIYVGSKVRHIHAQWEGEAVSKSTGDAVIVTRYGIEYKVVMDELRVI
jgi:hypothetical protein